MLHLGLGIFVGPEPDFVLYLSINSYPTIIGAFHKNSVRHPCINERGYRTTLAKYSFTSEAVCDFFTVWVKRPRVRPRVDSEKLQLSFS